MVPDSFIFLDVPDEVLVERVVGRRLDPVTGRIYHITFNVAETAEIAARLTQRSDDTEEHVKTRLKAFHQHIDAIADGFRDVLFRVDATNAPTDISRQIHEHLQRLQRYEVVFVLGGPGCGKGTQCSRLSAEFGYQHLSAGDLLREERAKNDSELGTLINDFIREGKIVPAEITIRLLLAAMASGFAASRQKKYLIDGFPRNGENMSEWFRMCEQLATVQCVLVFECPEDVLQQRLLKRGEVSGRIDDEQEAIKKRFAVFRNESMPVIQSFQRAGLARFISSIPPPDEVFANVSRIFRGLALIPATERTLALIKPDAVAAGAILSCCLSG